MFFDLIGWDGSAVPFEGPRSEHAASFISIVLEHLMGRLFASGLGLPLVLKAKPIYSSKLEAPGFFKAWIWIPKEARPYILAKARRTS